MSPSQPPKLPDLARLAQESGLDKNVMAFLRESGVNTSGVLFHLFSKRERVAKTLQPLEAGVRVQGTNVKLDFVAMGVAVAVLEHMVDQIELARKAQFVCGASAPTMTTSDASTSSAEDQKPPKVSQDFEKEVVAGQNRTFPSRQLVGAEEVTGSHGSRAPGFSPLHTCAFGRSDFLQAFYSKRSGESMGQRC